MRRLTPLLLVPALALAACGGQSESATDDQNLTTESAPPPPPAVPTAAMGEQIFKRCVACHTIDKDGRNGIGPNLHGVSGAALASKPDYNYSAALKAKGGQWDDAALDAFLTNPMKTIPGSKMAFAGVPDETDRAALILYLAAQSE